MYILTSDTDFVIDDKLYFNDSQNLNLKRETELLKNCEFTSNGSKLIKDIIYKEFKNRVKVLSIQENFETIYEKENIYHKYIIESYQSFKGDGYSLENRFSQFKKFFTLFELFEKYKYDNKLSYDFILRFRPDFILNNLNENLNLNKFDLNNDFLYQQMTNHINDWFMGSNVQVMKCIAHCYKFIGYFRYHNIKIYFITKNNLTLDLVRSYDENYEEKYKEYNFDKFNYNNDFSYYSYNEYKIIDLSDDVPFLWEIVIDAYNLNKKIIPVYNILLNDYNIKGDDTILDKLKNIQTKKNIKNNSFTNLLNKYTFNQNLYDLNIIPKNKSDYKHIQYLKDYFLNINTQSKK